MRRSFRHEKQNKRMGENCYSCDHIVFLQWRDLWLYILKPFKTDKTSTFVTALVISRVLHPPPQSFYFNIMGIFLLNYIWILFLDLSTDKNFRQRPARAANSETAKSLKQSLAADTGQNYLIIIMCRVEQLVWSFLSWNLDFLCYPSIQMMFLKSRLFFKVVCLSLFSYNHWYSKGQTQQNGGRKNVDWLSFK